MGDNTKYAFIIAGNDHTGAECNITTFVDNGEYEKYFERMLNANDTLKDKDEQ